jgi:hypothetical protein
MAKKRPLELTVVRTWIAAWKEKDLYSDAAVHHLYAPDRNRTSPPSRNP